MTKQPPRTFGADFKRFFLRGLVVLLPSVLTLWIVVKAYQFVDTTIAEPINRGVRISMIRLAPVWEPLREAFDPDPETVDAEIENLVQSGQRRNRIDSRVIIAKLRADNIQNWWSERWYMNFIGIVVAIVAVYIAGRMLGGFFGRRIYWRLENVITSLPIFKQVYPYVKQIVDFLFSDDQPIKFNRVVVVEYPRKGIWSVGFQTGNTLRAVAERAGDSVTVFIPSSPTPFTGYTITVARDEVIEVPITVDEAIRFAVSGGVLVPDHQLVPDSGKIVQPELPSGLIPLPSSGMSATSPAKDQPERDAG